MSSKGSRGRKKAIYLARLKLDKAEAVHDADIDEGSVTLEESVDVLSGSI